MYIIVQLCGKGWWVAKEKKSLMKKKRFRVALKSTKKGKPQLYRPGHFKLYGDLIYTPKSLPHCSLLLLVNVT